MRAFRFISETAGTSISLPYAKWMHDVRHFLAASD